MTMLAPEVEDMELLDFPPTCDPPFGTCDVAATWVIHLECLCPTIHLLCDRHVPDAKRVLEDKHPARCVPCGAPITAWDIASLNGCGVITWHST